MTPADSHHRSVPLRLMSGGLMNHVFLGYAAWRQRRHLSELDDALLKDIGVSRDQADTEARRPVWDVPAHWLQR
jgi:hypothetical protein